MTMFSDAELLREWLERQSEAAFHTLVARYAGLVQMAAVRAGCDAATATEVSQMTFITLARKASELAGRSSLGGWLYLTAVLQAKNTLSHQRHEARKRQSFQIHMETQQEPTAETWQRMQPLLNDAMKALSAGDREMLLLRFYRSLSISEIGVLLGIATETAQKRVSRATERLRTQFSRRGFQTGTALGAVLLAGLGAEADAAAPAASAITAKAIAAGSSGAGVTLSTLALMTTTKKTAIAAGALLLAGTTTVVLIERGQGARATPPPASADASTSPGTNPVSRTAGTDSAPLKPTTLSPGGKASPGLAALVVKYGDDRTKKSKAVALNGLGFAREILELDSAHKTGSDGVKALLGTVHEELRLTPAQEEQALALFEKATAAAMGTMKDRITRAEADPTEVMVLILASDAVARGEMEAEEFHKLAAAADAAIRLALHFPGAGFGLQSAAQHQEYRKSLLAILDPAQAEILKRDPGKEDTPLLDPPGIVLEERDKGLSSVRKILQAGADLEESGK